mmetsp:Transcript_29071/g.61082  ORF Transcript_29071/g.61082 Transcript_29071/m.61082 type:complete len:97 (+) Transcript_29071:3-293(+)
MVSLCCQLEALSLHEASHGVTDVIVVDCPAVCASNLNGDSGSKQIDTLLKVLTASCASHMKRQLSTSELMKTQIKQPMRMVFSMQTGKITRQSSMG